MTAPRLNATCLECGAEFTCVETKQVQEFCFAKCRQSWNNRRLQRGAMLYDLYMEHVFNKGEARTLKVFEAIGHLIADFRIEDDELRGDRRSWRRASQVLRDQKNKQRRDERRDSEHFEHFMRLLEEESQDGAS